MSSRARWWQNWCRSRTLRRIDLGIAAAAAVVVSGEPDALRTLLRNLMDNAVRYTSAQAAAWTCPSSTAGAAAQADRQR